MSHLLGSTNKQGSNGIFSEISQRKVAELPLCCMGKVFRLDCSAQSETAAATLSRQYTLHILLTQDLLRVLLHH